MRVAVVRDPGPQGRIEFEDRPDPVPAADEVVVRVAAVGVNSADLLLRKGLFGPASRVPGIDVAGTVAECGSGVDGLRIGTRVVLNPAVTCGHCEFCLIGEHGTCRQRQALGQQLDGGYAEYVVIPAVNVHPLDDHVTFAQAAAVPSNYFTAWSMLMNRAHLAMGETVLVTGATGGVGSAAVQIAYRAGARVIAAVGHDTKRQAAIARGADVTINYGEVDLAGSVMDATDGRGAHVIIDIVGPALWQAYLEAARPGCRIVTCSFLTGHDANFDVRKLMQRQISIAAAGGSGSKAVAARVVELVNSGQLKPQIDRVMPLSQAEEAHLALEARNVVGKIVLTP